jgi:ubiquitin-protein ligase E3 C
MGSLPNGALQPKSSVAAGKQVAESDSDSDSEGSVHLSVFPATFVPLPRIDERTSKRLQTLTAPTHINSLIRATHNHAVSRAALCDFLFALCSVWPLRVDSVLSTIVVSTSGGFVRELYRGYVRSSPLGKEVGLATLLGTSTFLLSHYLLTKFWQTSRMWIVGSRSFS